MAVLAQILAGPHEYSTKMKDPGPKEFRDAARILTGDSAAFEEYVPDILESPKADRNRLTKYVAEYKHSGKPGERWAWRDKTNERLKLSTPEVALRMIDSLAHRETLERITSGLDGIWATATIIYTAYHPYKECLLKLFVSLGLDRVINYMDGINYWNRVVKLFDTYMKHWPDDCFAYFKLDGNPVEEYDLYTSMSSLMGFVTTPIPGEKFDPMQQALELTSSGKNYWVYDPEEDKFCASYRYGAKVLKRENNDRKRTAHVSNLTAREYVEEKTSTLDTGGSVAKQTVSDEQDKYRVTKALLKELYSPKELLDMILNPKPVVVYSLMKPEQGKIRLAVNAGVDSYVGLNYVLYNIGDVYYSMRHTSLGESLTEKVYRVGHRLQHLNGSNIPLDFEAFDNQPTLEDYTMIMNAMKDECSLDDERRAVTMHNEAYHHGTFVVRDGAKEVRLPIESGLTSGLKTTSIVGLEYNLATTGTVIDTMKWLIKTPGPTTLCAQGDDFDGQFKTKYESLLFYTIFKKYGNLAHGQKFYIARGRTDFLRQSYKPSGRIRGILARSIVACTMLKPTTEVIPPMQELLLQRFSAHYTAMRRAGIRPSDLAFVSLTRRFEHELTWQGPEIRRLARTTNLLGGLGYNIDSTESDAVRWENVSNGPTKTYNIPYFYSKAREKEMKLTYPELNNGFSFYASRSNQGVKDLSVMADARDRVDVMKRKYKFVPVTVLSSAVPQISMGVLPNTGGMDISTPNGLQTVIGLLGGMEQVTRMALTVPDGFMEEIELLMHDGLSLKKAINAYEFGHKTRVSARYVLELYGMETGMAMLRGGESGHVWQSIVLDSTGASIVTLLRTYLMIQNARLFQDKGTVERRAVLERIATVAYNYYVSTPLYDVFIRV